MTYVAFVRAINVGGHAAVRMEDVRAAFARAGCSNVRTVIQSGNVVFESRVSRRSALTTRICQRLEPLVGKVPGVCLRTADELASILEADAFKKFSPQRDVKMYVAFLGGTPQRSPRLPLRDEKEALELLAATPSDVVIISRKANTGRYGSPYGVVEKAFGVDATIRNSKTVSRIAQLIAPERAGRSGSRPPAAL